jgi:hypothetical protein
MTICLAANCAGSKAVVVASDRMLSAPFLTLEFDHPDAKIDEVSQTCVALTSGDALAAQDVLAEGAGMAGQLQKPLITHFADQIRQKFVEARRRVASEQVLEPRGMSFDEFYQAGAINRLPGDLALLMDSQIQQLRLGVSVLLAGVDRAGAHIFAIEDPGTTSCFDRLGYHAIGSGHRHALLTLVGQNQHKSTGINRTVFNVYAAKRAAEAAPGVGTATEMRIITESGILQVEQATLALLAPIYAMHVNPKLPKVVQAINKLPFEQEDGNG